VAEEDKRQPERVGVADTTAGRVPSVLALLGNLRDEVQRLVRGERALFRLEAQRRRAGILAGAGMFAGTAFVGFFVLGCLVTLTAVALAGVLPPWLATLIVLAALLLIVGILALTGVKWLRSHAGASAEADTGPGLSTGRDGARWL
jgi:hypothetical protein